MNDQVHGQHQSGDPGLGRAGQTGYIVTLYGWDAAFLLLAGLCPLAALLFIPLDCSKRVYAEGPALQPA